MENRDKETFSYTYSAKEQTEIQNIRKKYETTTEQEDKMAQLRRLDAEQDQKLPEYQRIEHLPLNHFQNGTSQSELWSVRLLQLLNRAGKFLQFLLQELDKKNRLQV